MARGQILTALVVLGLVAGISADVFLQGCICGSNNKFNENSNTRNNANRLFDSQNGNDGGCTTHTLYYANPRAIANIGPAAPRYYVGSVVPLFWHAQHGGGSTNLNIDSEFVVQYFCSWFGPNATTPVGAPGSGVIPWDMYQARDGGFDPNTANTNTPQFTQGCPSTDDATNADRGQHEPCYYFDACDARHRNAGLYIADQNLDNTARDTRQESNGNNNQFGFECTEERDYWPYWHPTPFRDVAVLTSRYDSSVYGGINLCTWMQTNSQNVQPKNLCWPNSPADNRTCWTFNSLTECAADSRCTWTSFPSWGLDAPICRDAGEQMENHLGWSFDTRGGVDNGYAAGYNFTIPATGVYNYDNEGCWMRLRYNLTQREILFDYDASYNNILTTTGPGNNRYMDVNPTIANIPVGIAFQTDQTPRNFEDRSHRFIIRPRPSTIPATALIYNFGVIGMRGALQNIFPMMENDMCPKYLTVEPNSFVHIQWAGTIDGQANNGNNAGGAGGDLNVPARPPNPAYNAADNGQQYNRHNLVLVESRRHYPIPANQALVSAGGFWHDEAEMTYFAYAGQDAANCAPTGTADATNQDADANCGFMNTGSIVKKWCDDAMPQDCTAGVAYAGSEGIHYVDWVMRMDQPLGTYNFFGTRNTISTNRDEKSYITVGYTGLSPAALYALIVGGGLGLIALVSVIGTYYYAKRNPDSAVARVYDKVGRAFGTRSY